MATLYGHRARFDVSADADMPIVTDKILWYAFGMGGRIFDLPRQYQDAIARTVIIAHPQSFYRRELLYCLVSGRFARSMHPQLVGLNQDEVRELCNALARRYRRTRRQKVQDEIARARLTRDDRVIR